jgi:hypothetical protein
MKRKEREKNMQQRDCGVRSLTCFATPCEHTPTTTNVQINRPAIKTTAVRPRMCVGRWTNLGVVCSSSFMCCHKTLAMVSNMQLRAKRRKHWYSPRLFLFFKRCPEIRIQSRRVKLLSDTEKKRKKKKVRVRDGTTCTR